MGVSKYMQRMIDKARGKVQKGIEKISPYRKFNEAMGSDKSVPAQTPERSNPVPAKKRKKIKPNTVFD